ncbi:MAG: hypothetical protein CL845_07135, partial [Crocinitomicaceae bacterium]|nr:hypothetical protein [Crocinitomicaceae bacterium]
MKRILVMLCAVALAFNSNAQEVSATYDPDVDGDNNIGVTDLLALLSLFSENDLDDDGIWDSQDDCVGEYDECGVCNGPGPQILGIDTIIIYYDSLYAEAIDEWWVFEVDADTLLTYLCENPGCMDPTADNYDPYAIEEDNSCVWAEGSPACDYQNSFTFDDYMYNLVAIGDQCWFAENLRNQHYANGDVIPSGYNTDEWGDLITGASVVLGNQNQGTLLLYLSSNSENGWGDNSIIVRINDELVGDLSSEDAFSQFDFPITELDEIQIEYVEVDSSITQLLSLTVYNCGFLNATSFVDLTPGIIYDLDAACEFGASEYLDSYGRLYNWYAVEDSRGLCPSGWHVPTDGEFMTLEMELGMSELEANSTSWRGTDQ